MRGRVGVVIPAAGRGERLGRALSKAFVPVSGRPLISHALSAFQRALAVNAIVLVVRPQDRARMQRLVRRLRATKVRAVVNGGPSRAASVARGVAALPPEVRWVLVHDAARPCVTPHLITAVIRHAKRFGAVACGLRSPVTVKAVDEHGQVRLTLDRESLWLIQTPQAFRRDWFAQALAQVNGLPAPRPAVFYIYAILCDNGSIYIGHTDDLHRRWLQHTSGQVGWTKRHCPISIVHHEEFSSLEAAVKREHDLKTGYGRKWLKRLIQSGRARQAGTLDQFPDDAALLERAGFPVRMVPGDPLNIKVTTPDDLLLAKTILRSGFKGEGSRRPLHPRT